MPLVVCTVIGPGDGPALASQIRVPPVTLLAFDAPVDTAVLPTTVVTPDVTLMVVVRVGGLGPIVCDRAIGEHRQLAMMPDEASTLAGHELVPARPILGRRRLAPQSAIAGPPDQE